MSSEKSYPLPTAPNANDFYPLQDPAPGSLLPAVRAKRFRLLAQTLIALQDVFPNNAAASTLFKPITLRGTTFANRVFVVCTIALLYWEGY